MIKIIERLRKKGLGTVFMHKQLVFWVIVVSTLSAVAGDHDVYVLCKNQKTVRSLRIRDATSQKGCEVVYTKDGVSRVEGVGQSFEGCLKILENIKSNLEKAWWKCQDVTKTVQIEE